MAPWLLPEQGRCRPEGGYYCAAVSDMGLLGSLHNPDWEASDAVQNDTEIIIEHHVVGAPGQRTLRRRVNPK